MCFSATASFSAGALLLGIGTLTLRSALAAHRQRELAFAAIPMLFALQQLIEGVIWLTFSHEAPLLNSVMTHAYSFFSHVLWPVYVPLAVLLMEPAGWRRRALVAFVAAGVTVGVYLLYVLLAFPVVSRPTGQHIEYDSPHFFAARRQGWAGRLRPVGGRGHRLHETPRACETAAADEHRATRRTSTDRTRLNRHRPCADRRRTGSPH